MSTPQPPDESAESSLAAVYTEDAQPVLCGILTDLNLHRFTLHQQLTTHDSLSETPLWREPLHNNLPTPITQLLQQYRVHINLATTQLRKALDVLDTLGRRQPSANLLDPTLIPSDFSPLTQPVFPPTSTLQPGEQVHIAPNIQYHLPTTPTRAQLHSDISHRSPHTKCSKQIS